ATKVYKRFDRIFTVSEEAREKLVKMVPSINDKTKVFTNMISPELIIEEAKMGVGFQQDNFTGIRIVTVGRLAFEKGQDLAIKAMVKLIKDGINVKWYCIGEGKGRKEYEELIDRYQLQDKFILLGENSNPYRFIKECDIYVQPSRHEGYCITLAEARALDRPIVTTSFTGAKEQVKHNETGLVVSIHEDQIYYAVKGLIYNPKQREKFSRNLSNEMFESIGRIGRIYNIV
ncbi:MAG TPA: glycosyltransferase, partial [Tissierellaceae bacterium]|nr:glycosyltransferase [Tissierellaceae bacterium]